MPNPYTLAEKEKESGNPLAEYREMLRRERDYLKDVGIADAFAGLLPPERMSARTYAEARATAEANLGLIQRSLRTQAIGDYQNKFTQPALKTGIEGLRPVGAVDYILRQADTHSWLMFGEEHMKPQTRTLLLPLLRGLYKKGFRYFAAETFSSDIAKASRAGYVTWSDGTYTADPIFAEAVREAIRLGFRLVPYDDTPRPTEVPPNDPLFSSNFREHAQAARLKERILDRDAKAKVLVWGGRSHVVEEPDTFPDGQQIRPMASEFKKMTGLDPFTSYLPLEVEGFGAEWERVEYKAATQAGLVRQPCILLDQKNKPFHMEKTDATVFFPRTTYVQGRPDWLVRELGRRAVKIPTSLLAGGKGVLLTQARYAGDPPTAVPIDQIALLPGNPLPALMLPKEGRFQIRVIDADGKVLGETQFP